MTEERAETLAERIKASRKTLRYEERAFCPADGRLVAAVVIFEGERCLWFIGGRAGSHQQMLEELQLNIDDARADIEDMERRGVSRDLQESHRTALQNFERIKAQWEREGWPAWAPGMAWRLGDNAALRPGHPTPCPGCRRDVFVTRNAEGALVVVPKADMR